MKKLIPFSLLALSSCIADPCIPTEVQRVVDRRGEVIGPNHLSLYESGSCRLISVEPYAEWMQYGVVAYLETWQCGCGG